MLQGDSLISPQKGLWIEIQGKVITVFGDPKYQLGVLFTYGELPAQSTVECKFSGTWMARLSPYNKGDAISVRGKIGPH